VKNSKEKQAEGHPTAFKDAEGWPLHELESVPSCPVCGGNSRRPLYQGLTDRVFCVAPGKWTLFRCDACGSAWLDPRPSPGSIGRAYQRYYTHVSDDDPAAHPSSAIVRKLHALQSDYQFARYGVTERPAAFGGRWLIPLIPSLRAKADVECRHLPAPPANGGRLLDVGCGNGGFLKLATERGWNAEGIDFDPAAVAVARGRGLTVSQTTAATLEDSAACKYDIITISHVIEHVHNPLKLLGNLYRLLKPDGQLWLETPNLSSLGARRFGPSWQALDPPRHLVLFTRESLISALENVGFREIKQQWQGMVLFSVYAESAAIASGRCACEANHPLIPTFVAVLDELREMFRPKHREHLIVTARK
jgi:2-polyprenyl-3-methyl-5-hydroxy-6-metoxy-1,4-benzoquinol methylase